MDPNIDAWINQKYVDDATLYEPKDGKKEFLKWLQKCHKEFDREFKFTFRLFDSGPGSEYPPGVKYGNESFILSQNPFSYQLFCPRCYHISIVLSQNNNFTIVLSQVLIVIIFSLNWFP